MSQNFIVEIEQIEVKQVEINLDWTKEFQEFQEILSSNLHPDWLYSAKTNMVLEPAYTGQGKQFFYTKDIIEASKVIPFF